MLINLPLFAQMQTDSVDCSNRVAYSWMKSFGTALDETANDIVTDSDDNIFITGTFTGVLTVQGQSVTSLGGSDYYVAKFTPQGDLVWLKSGGSSGNDEGVAIDVDSDDNIIVAGNSYASPSYNGNTYTSRGDKDAFVLKITNNGDFIFAKTIGFYLEDAAYDVVVDNDNNIAVAGYYQSMIQFGSYTQSAMGAKDLFVVRFDPNGNFQWATNFGSYSDDKVVAITCDASNNLYIIGEFADILRLGAGYQSAGESDVFVIKLLGTNGGYSWALKRGSALADEAMGIATDPSGIVYIAYKDAALSKTVFEKINAYGTTVLSSRQYPSEVTINKLLCTDATSVYMAGMFLGNVDFGSDYVIANSGAFFIIKYNSYLNLDNEFYGNATRYSSVNSIYVDNTNSLLAAGEFDTMLSLGLDTQTAVGEKDALVIKFESYISSGEITVGNNNCDPNNMSVSIDVNGGEAPFRYYWSNGATTQSQTGISAGSYVVTIVDNNNCYITTNVEISAPQPPATGLPVSMMLCPVDTIQIEANSGLQSYLWNTGATTSAISVSSSGTYSVTVVDDNSCSASSSVIVSQYPNIEVFPNDEVYFCPGDTLILTAAGFLEYLWSNGSAVASQTVTSPATFSVRVNNGICYYYDTVAVSQYPAPQLNLGDDIFFCDGDGVAISAPQGFDSYIWDNGATTSSLWLTESATLHLDIVDTNGCKAFDDIVVTKVQNPVVDLGNDTTYCTDGKVLLSSSAAVMPGSTYMWSNGENTNSIAVESTGTYSLTITNAYGCTGEDEVNIHIIRVVPIELPDEISGCDEATITCPHSYQSYSWSTGETTSSIKVDYSEIFYLSVVDSNGCVVDDSVKVIINEVVEPFFGNDTVFCTEGTHRLYLQQSYAQYAWSNNTSRAYLDVKEAGRYSVTVTDNNGCTSTSSMYASYATPPDITSINSGKGIVTVEAAEGTPPYYYSADGINWQASCVFDELMPGVYTMFVMDNNYCKDSLNTYLDGSLGIPSFFTPNSDGYNDTWVISGLHMYPNSRVFIYNRFGKELYQAHGKNFEWDGRYGREPLPSDTYWYVVDLGYGQVPIKGSVTIKR